MKLTLTIDCDSLDEFGATLCALGAVADAVTEINDEAKLDSPEMYEVPPVTMEDANTALPAEEPKKRGRPKKPKAEAVSAGAEVLEQLKASVAETVPDNVVPLKKADPIEAAVFGGVPEPAPAAPTDITTGQQLQEYILSLVHQKRLSPVDVKATVYPKFNVIRSLDLLPEQVPAAKAAIDALLKDEAPKAANDLDL